MKPIPVEAGFAYRRYGATAAPTPAILRLIVPLSIGLIAGTGGTYAAGNLCYASTIFQNPIIEVRGHQVRRDYVISFAEQIIAIRDALGLKMSEVAQILGVTRPAAYAWVNGSEPKPEIKIKINRLRRLVDDLHGAGIKRIDLYARRPLGTGHTLIDSMKTGSDVAEVVSAIKRTALQPVPADSVIQLGPANRKRVVDLDEISTPIIG